ncbi:hypothetical protein HC928_00530 [bacterium]|nr:hypothetical protein [bacterium]
MDPLTAATLISGGSTILGSILGGSGNAQNNAIAAMNLEEQRRANRAREEAARRAERYSLAGQESPSGSEAYYDPLTNTWRSSLSPIDQQLLELTQQAQQQRLGPDEYRYARGQEQDFKARLEADSVARAILGEATQGPVISGEDIYGDEYLRNFAGQSGAQDKMLEAVLGGALATGTNMQGAIGKMASARAQGGQPNLPSRTQSRMQAMNLNQQLRGSNIDQYGAMRGRSVSPGTPQPSAGVNEGMSAVIANMAGRPAQATLQGMYGTQPAQMQPFQPDNDMALKTIGIGQALSSIFERGGGGSMYEGKRTAGPTSSGFNFSQDAKNLPSTALRFS